MPGSGPSVEVRRASNRAGGSAIPPEDKFDRKLKRLRQIEAGYRADIRRAQQTMKRETVDRTKAEQRYEKVRRKLEGKIEKLQPKIRDLTNRKAEMRS